jgi:hypothetical protein
MAKHSIVKIIALSFLLFSVTYSQVKRGRNEGTFNIPASNVMGNGNMAISGAMSGSIGRSKIHLDPWVGMNVGIASILQLSGKLSVEDFKRLGGMEARLQVTTPGNDRLRFFGVSILGELYLSTEMDTLSGTALTGKPEFNAYIRPSLIADGDWIAKYQRLPLKTYLYIGLSDNPDLLYMYSQIALRCGVELKFERNSYAIDIGCGFYKEKSRRLTGYTGDASYAQQRVWIEPMVRYRLFDRATLLCSVRALVVQRVKKVRALEPEYLRIATAIETPIVFKETNSEAIRTMIFVEHNKNAVKDSTGLTIDEKKKLASDSLHITIDGLDLEQTTNESEKEILKRREDIQKKMEEIEQLLEDIQ